MPRQPNSSPQTFRVLALLLASPREWHYGYGISRRTGLAAGTLYPILARLADQGWVETQWVESPEPGRPPRHTYRLTGEGLRSARAQLAIAPRALRLRLSSTGR
jgi:DNA-binding PadR family transcriptional regulator